MFREVERAARAAYRAWGVGDLKKAIALLEPFFMPRVPPEVFFTLARACSEHGECDRALQILDQAVSSGADARVARLYRGTALLDHSRSAEAAAELSELASENPIAGGLLALIRLEKDEAAETTLSIPRAARWMADISGRLLAILEERLLGGGETELTRFHHGLFLPISANPKEAIEAAFVASRFDEVARLSAGGKELDPNDAVYAAFALTSLGKDEEAGAALSTALEEDPANADLHFLEGLRHSRFQRRKNAGWSFVRAARARDVDVDDVVCELSSKVGVSIRLFD